MPNTWILPESGEVGQLHSVEGHGPGGYLVLGVSRDGVGEGGFPGAAGPGQGGDGVRWDVEAQVFPEGRLLVKAFCQV